MVDSRLINKYFNELLACGFIRENILIFNENEQDNFCDLVIDVLYVCGGNIFTLVKLIKDCSFDKQIIKYLHNGVVYIGRSVGTHLVTKNVEYILAFDENYIGLRDFNALGLFEVFCSTASVFLLSDNLWRRSNLAPHACSGIAFAVKARYVAKEKACLCLFILCD